MKDDFYDKAALKFGGYGYRPKPSHTDEYPSGDPEQVFKEQIIGLGKKHKIALDIGCADGKFTLSIAPFFQKVYGIDTSHVNLEIAKRHQTDELSRNVDYSLQDASKTSFENDFFDVAYCRRGPSFYEEYRRILKTEGYYLEIGIGELDAVELKKIFKRGQGYGTWDKSRLDENLKKLKGLGFQTIFAENYHYYEYYPSYEELDYFLQGVPIFEDYDPEKDKSLLEQYVGKFHSEKGIQLPRHRLVLVMRKS